MGLADQWTKLEADLPSDWGETRVVLRLERTAEVAEASALLTPLAPLRTDDETLSITITRDPGGPGSDSLRRGLVRLDNRRLEGRLSLHATREQTTRPPAALAASLAESWRSALATLPADWSDLLGEVELDSSDYLDRAAVQLAPLNPRRHGELTALRFRSASRFGYGASAGMVDACLSRCDRDGIRGRVRVLRVLCDSQPVGTQGPVWQIDGEMT
jgi:hypothetical protein